MFGLGLITLPLLIAAVAIAGLSLTRRSRTPDGMAVLAQAEGFRRYLSTAEAATVRFEEGRDVASRYLPYAIVFGVAERRLKIFDELRASGRNPQTAEWAGGADVHALASMASTMGSTLTSSLMSAPRFQHSSSWRGSTW